MTSPVLPPFTVTQSAISAIADLGGGIRLGLEPGGCCGNFYAFNLVDPASTPARDADHRFGCEGAWLFVAPEALAVMTGATLDHGARLKPPRFRVLKNPNTQHTCACRRSFGVPWPGPGQPQCRSYAPMPWDGDYEPPREWQRRTGWSRPDGVQ